MLSEHDPAASQRLLSLAANFHNEQYRNGYVASHTRGVLARQMRNFRGGLSQAEYAEKLNKQKTMIARLENPAYAGWSLRTMLDIARKEKVALLCCFVDFPTFLNFTDDMSDDAFHPHEYDEVLTDDIASYLSGATTYYDFGAIHTMVAKPPYPYADIFVGSVGQFGITASAVQGGSGTTVTIPNVISGSGQSIIWGGSYALLGSNIFSDFDSAPALPSGVTRTQAAIRWLSDLAIAQQSEIKALQSELTTTRQRLATAHQQLAVENKISPVPRYPARRQIFGDPLAALREAV